MINQPILMDAGLGKLVTVLCPETVKKFIKVDDEENFHQILSVLGLEGRVAKERWTNISFEVEASYSFLGIDNSKSGYVLVFGSNIWVCPSENGSVSGWNVVKFHLYDRFFNKLNKMLKISSRVEMDIPDIEEMKIFGIDTSSERLEEKGRYWRMVK